MKTVLDFPGETSVATVFRRKPKIACLHPEVGPERPRAYGRFKLGVCFHEAPRASLKVKILDPGVPPAAQENQTDKK